MMRAAIVMGLALCAAGAAMAQEAPAAPVDAVSDASVRAAMQAMGAAEVTQTTGPGGAPMWQGTTGNLPVNAVADVCDAGFVNCRAIRLTVLFAFPEDVPDRAVFLAQANATPMVKATALDDATWRYTYLIVLDGGVSQSNLDRTFAAFALAVAQGARQLQERAQ